MWVVAGGRVAREWCVYVRVNVQESHQELDLRCAAPIGTAMQAGTIRIHM